MIGKLNHIAVAVPDLEQATSIYRDVLGAKVSNPHELPEHGVTAVFVHLENTKIELIQPLGDKSPIDSFLKRNTKGGIHHLCYEVEDIFAAKDQLTSQGMTILGTGEPYLGANNKLVLFLHPKNFMGSLIELEQAN
ncbi:MAG: methylmalonyl-CoA epimerase [Candidatus Marinimicrobia bacterium]|jgi:methylmalonyl-CoA/ethylmalonyl-CoA epimerase|nr:methylmalonyl-CoA epimerase [Candidatus Neomarinimicrobiota bacterium]|tara:strand:+ start:162 stop:569 length:408 start_codon:yes stop_codon:yes gene_type:complete